MLFLWPPYYVSATCTDNAAWTNLFWYACVCWLLAQNDSRFSAMSLAINWVLKIHIQHRWTCHTICSLRIKKLERKTRETWKYVHVFSRWWRLNSADSSCSFFPLEDIVAISAQDCTTIKQHFTVTMTEQRSFHLKISFFTKVMATIAIHRVSTTRWVHRKSFVHFSAMQGQILLERAWYKLEYLWAAPVCRTTILKFSTPIHQAFAFLSPRDRFFEEPGTYAHAACFCVSNLWLCSARAT